MKTQFEIENLPYLQTDHCRIDKQQNQPWKFETRIYNIGKYPAKIISTKFGVSVQSSAFNKQSFFKDIKVNNVSSYITEKYPFSVYLTYDSLKGIDSFQDIYTSKQNIYFAGDIIYMNMVTNQKRRFEFVYKTKPQGTSYSIEQFKIDNYYIE